MMEAKGGKRGFRRSPGDCGEKVEQMSMDTERSRSIEVIGHEEIKEY